jgi:hypothetical protein
MRKKPDGHEYLGAGVAISGLSGELRLKIERTIELTRFTASDDKVVSTLPSRRRCRGNCRELVVDRLRRRSQHCPPSARNGISRRNIADRLDTRRRWALARHHSSRFLASLMACRRTLRNATPVYSSRRCANLIIPAVCGSSARTDIPSSRRRQESGKRFPLTSTASYEAPKRG